MEIGIVGKPNCGKSTFFSAATLVDAAIANYPFTTINPNFGVGYVRSPCPCAELKKACNPNNSKCAGGVRLIPIKLIDVAGLVPGAHEGRGLGNKFLDDLRQASALIQVIDLSGSTDLEGKPVSPSPENPVKDIEFLAGEVSLWLRGIMEKQFAKFVRKQNLAPDEFYKFAAESLAGLGFTESTVRFAVSDCRLDPSKPSHWSGDDLLRFASRLREIGKPIIIAANKADLPASKENLERLKKEFPDLKIIPTCAEAELALRKAERAGLIDYVPGAGDFKAKAQLNDKQEAALDFIRESVISRYGSTGVQQVLDEVAYSLLNLIPVYPVEDEHKFSDKKGNVLPDVFLVPKGSTALDLAFRVHTDIGKNFIAAINARTKMKLAKDYQLKLGDIIKIVARA